MIRFFALIFFSFLVLFNLIGMPANPKLIKLADGSRIFLKGDEYNKWGLTEDGYTILPVEDGWVYAKQSTKGFAVPSNFILKDTLDLETKLFLNSQSKRIPIESVIDTNIKYSNPRSSENDNNAIVGERKALVIMMAFTDLDFIKSQEDFNRLFNEIGYSEDGAIGSVFDYFSWSSDNQLKFSCDVLGPYLSSHDMKYYGRNIGSEGRDQNTFALFQEALSYAKDSVDLSDYDSNHDGYVDNIHIIFAGYGEEAGAKSDAIWSHEMTFPPIEIGDLKIDRYSCAPELRGNSGNNISRIGPHCHEMGHALGAMDYYDVDYQNNGQYIGTGEWDIMATGSWNNDGISPPDFNPYVKVFNFGWVQPRFLVEGYNEIQPISEDSNQIFFLPTTIKDDFYLIENRSQIGFDSGIPGEGLLIFHIGPDIVNRSKKNLINSYFPQQCYVVCASSEFQIPSKSAQSYGDIDSSGCPFPGSTDNRIFSDTSIPAASCIDGSESGIILSEISYIEGSSNIGLYNGSLPQPLYVWEEDFESSDWTNRWIINDEEWKFAAIDEYRNDYKYNKENEFPIIHDSNYLYSKLPTSLNNKENHRTVQTNDIVIEENCRYTLSFNYYNSPKIFSNRDHKNYLNIYVNTQDNESFLLNTFESSDYNWEYQKVDIPMLQDTNIVSFVFEHCGRSAGYVCIDDLKLQKEEHNCVKDLLENELKCLAVSVMNNNVVITSPKDMIIKIFDPYGRLMTNEIVSKGVTSLTLSNGIYILANDEIKPLKIIVH